MMKRAEVMTFLALNRTMVGMLLMVILVDMGERLGERFLPIYILALGGGVYAVGALNAIDNFFSALYSYFGGVISEAVGEKRALRYFNLFAIVGFVIVVFFPYWQAVLFGALFFISWSAISLPAMMSLVSDVLPLQKRTMGVSLHSLVRRIPMALGPLIGGVSIDYFGVKNGVRVAFILAICMAVYALFLAERMLKTRKVEQEERDVLSMFELWKCMAPELKRLLLSDILVRFCEQIPYAFVVVWCMQCISLPVSGAQFGVLTAIEMLTALLIYIPVAYFADRGQKKPFIVTTFIFFALFPLSLLYAQSFWSLVAAFVLRGLKEFGEPTRKALIMDLALEGHKAGMFGLYYLIRDVLVAGGVMLGAYLWKVSPELNFISASFFGFLGAAWLGLTQTQERAQRAGVVGFDR